MSSSGERGETSKADGNIRQRRSIAQTANTLNTAVGEAVKSSDGRGASVQPVSHELVGKLTIKRRKQSEEDNHWFDLRAGNAVSFCANEHDND